MELPVEYKSFLNLNKEELINIIIEYKSQEQAYKLQFHLLKELINDTAKHCTDIDKDNELLKIHSILFDNAKDIIFYLKLDGSIIDVNKTAIEKYGYSRLELLDMNLVQLRHPSTIKFLENQMRVSELEGIVFECIHVRKNGTSFPVEASSRSIDINGELFRVDIIRDITQRKQSEENLRYLANYDVLTDIPNRRSLMRQFNKTLEQAKRGNLKFAVMLFDVDNFKLINDTHGHNAGDEVLKVIAKRLQEVIRKVDIIGRFGGDEFLVVQTFIKTKEDASVLATRLLNYIVKPIKWNDFYLNVYISIGIAIYPEDSNNTQGLIHIADSAMYSIKQKCGNGYSFYVTG